MGGVSGCGLGLTTRAIRRASDFGDLFASFDVPEDGFMYTRVMLGGEREGGRGGGKGGGERGGRKGRRERRRKGETEGEREGG